MDAEDEARIRMRIEKDIAMFEKNISAIDRSCKYKKIIDLSEMYASDSRSYLKKCDYYTSFSCISYAHGLLDAIVLILEVEDNVH